MGPRSASHWGRQAAVRRTHTPLPRGSGAGHTPPSAVGLVLVYRCGAHSTVSVWARVWGGGLGAPVPAPPPLWKGAPVPAPPPLEGGPCSSPPPLWKGAPVPAPPRPLEGGPCSSPPPLWKGDPVPAPPPPPPSGRGPLFQPPPPLEGGPCSSPPPSGRGPLFQPPPLWKGTLFQPPPPPLWKGAPVPAPPPPPPLEGAPGAGSFCFHIAYFKSLVSQITSQDCLATCWSHSLIAACPWPNLKCSQTSAHPVTMLRDRRVRHQSNILCGCTTFGTELKLGPKLIQSLRLL